MPVDRPSVRADPAEANGNRAPGLSQSWKRRGFYLRPGERQSQTEPPRHRKPTREEGSLRGKTPHRGVRFGEHRSSSSSTPGAPAWIVELVFTALGEGDTYVLQRAMQALSALEQGSARWRSVNHLLENRTPSSVAAAATALAEREEQVQSQLGSSSCPSCDFDVTARNFSHEDMNGNVYSGCTYYVKPPSDWRPVDPNGKPPDIERAPVSCLFLMPKRPYDPDEPYRVWILDDNRRWVVVEQYAAHPDPKFHPRILRLQPNDKTPNWVLPDSVRRKPPRKAPLPQPETQPEAQPSSRPGVQRERTPNAVPGPSRTTPGSSSGQSATSPSWSRSARNT